MAGCATPTRSAGHAPAGATADTKLTFQPDHPVGAGHYPWPKKGWGMRLRDAVFAVFGAMLASSQAVAGTYSSSHFSNVVAAEVVPNQGDFQLYFTIRAGTFWGEEMDGVAPSNGVYYQYLGTVEMSRGDASKILYAGDGIFMPAGTSFHLKAIGIIPQRTYLQFLLSSTPDSELV